MGGTKTDENERPPESHEHGCPGGWYRTPFFDSVQRYAGERSYYKIEDRLIADALRYYAQQSAIAARPD